MPQPSQPAADAAARHQLGEFEQRWQTYQRSKSLGRMVIPLLMIAAGIALIVFGLQDSDARTAFVRGGFGLAVLGLVMELLFLFRAAKGNRWLSLYQFGFIEEPENKEPVVWDLRQLRALVTLPVANAAPEGNKYDATGLVLFSLDGKLKGSPSLGDHGANIAPAVARNSVTAKMDDSLAALKAGQSLDFIEVKLLPDAISALDTYTIGYHQISQQSVQNGRFSVNGAGQRVEATANGTPDFALLVALVKVLSSAR